MRLVQVAKLLGISGQELRKELSQVDFGVKPTDREVSDNLAMGVIRFVAQKRKITVDWDMVEAIRSGKIRQDTDEVPAVPTKEEAVPTTQKQSSKPAEGGGLNVLRKLTLDGVSKEAIDRERQALARQQAPQKLSKIDHDQRRSDQRSSNIAKRDR